MHVHVDAPRRCDETLRIAYRCRRSADQIGVNAIHNRGIAGFAYIDDAAVFDANIAFHDPQYRVDDKRVAKQHVQRSHGAVETWSQPKTVAQRLATTMQ